MCLAIPGKVIKIESSTVTIEYNKELQREANCSLIECKIGDYVIVQAGFVIEIVNERRAKDMHKLVTGDLRPVTRDKK
mgnify:CR=1 FL=1